MESLITSGKTNKMPRRIYDFKCNSCNEVFEKYADTSVALSRCECGGEAKRLISTSMIKLDGTTGDFPGAALKWDKKREEKLRLERKQNS